MRKIAALAAALALFVAGCTKTTPGQTAGGRNPWTHPGSLTIGTADEPDSLNEMFGHSDATDQVANLIFEPPFRYDQNGELVPAAVTEVPSASNGGIRDGGKTIVLHFRKGMRWSDGAPYDARDLAFTWKAVMNDRNNAKLRVGWDVIASIDLPDDDTAVIHLKHAYASILGIFAYGGSAVPPLPAHLLAALPDINHAPFNSAPISSGPFVLVRWNHGSSLEFKANPNYWRGAPALSRITYKIVPNADTLFNQAMTHEVDVYDSVNEVQVGRLGEIKGASIVKRLIANWRHVGFNTARPNLHDVRVRRAIAMAIDWDRINATVYHGYNERAVSDIFPASWAAPAIPQWRYDPQEAARLLDEAGWHPGKDGIRRKNGAPLTTSISTTPAKQANVQAELQMQQQLRAVGIDLRIKNYLPNLLFAQDGPIYTGKFDMEFTIETNAPDPDNEGLWSGAFIPPHGANTSWLDDPVITRTSHEAATTFDRARRKVLYQQEEARIHELVPAVFLYWQNSYSIVNSDLKYWKPASYISDFWNCWQWSI